MFSHFYACCALQFKSGILNLNVFNEQRNTFIYNKKQGTTTYYHDCPSNHTACPGNIASCWRDLVTITHFQFIDHENTTVSFFNRCRLFMLIKPSGRVWIILHHQGLFVCQKAIRGHLEGIKMGRSQPRDDCQSFIHQ